MASSSASGSTLSDSTARNSALSESSLGGSALADSRVLSAPGSGAEVKPLGPVDGDVGEALDRFDVIYREAAGDLSKVPWAHRSPCPWMVSWMNAQAPGLIRCGARVAVVGCGLGADAIELRERGYDVLALDVSPSAIHWAKTLHPEHGDIFMQADLLDLPARVRNRFDLVVEVHTLQSLPPRHRGALATGMACMLSPRGGILLAICRGRSADQPLESLQGPPYPLTGPELSGLMESCGLGPLAPVDEFMDDNNPPVHRIRGSFRRV